MAYTNAHDIALFAHIDCRQDWAAPVVAAPARVTEVHTETETNNVAGGATGGIELPSRSKLAAQCPDVEAPGFIAMTSACPLNEGFIIVYLGSLVPG